MKHIFGIVVTFAVVVISLTTHSVVAQEVLYEVNLESYFDNREYGVSEDSKMLSGTDFAVRFAPKVDLRFGVGNSLNLGVDMVHSLGCNGSLFDDVEALIYYGYDSDRWSLSVGIFERDRIMIDGYSTLFFSDDYLLEDNLVEGLAVRYISEMSYVEMVCDWLSELGVDQRERFEVLSSGRKYWSNIYVGYNFSLRHFAGEDNDIIRNVVDNILVNPSVGVLFDWGNYCIDAKLTYLQALQRDRSYGEEWLYPAMGEVALKVEHRGFSLDERFYFGDDMMPLYGGHVLDDGSVLEYGSQLYAGSIFYRAYGGFYNRASLRYDRSFCGDKIRLRAEFVTHVCGSGFATEQLLDFSVRLGGDLINKKR